MLSTFEHRSFDLADIPIVFKPQTDLAILNYIANHIIQTGRVNQDFVDKHTQLPLRQRPTSATACGPSIRWRRRRRQRQGPDRLDSRSTSTSSPSSSATYTLEYTAELTGVPRAGCRRWPSSTPIPKIKVMSFWTMGFNQHIRGVWANHMVYNIHLLTGKIAEPGNSPFSLTGQPSACGTAREVGTFAHRLPADMVVTNPEHRKHAEEIWKLPARH